MKKYVVIFVAFLFLVSCAPKPKINVMRYTTDSFRPTNHIDVLHTKPVEKDYMEIAEISIRLNKKTREYGVAYLKEKAKQLGADAIILLGERSRGAVAVPVGSMLLAVPLKDICAIAIKYK